MFFGRRATSTHVTSRTYVEHGLRRPTDDGRQYWWHYTRYPVCQRPGQWIRSLRSKTGCIKRGGRLRRPSAVLLRRAPSVTVLYVWRGGRGAYLSLLTFCMSLSSLLTRRVCVTRFSAERYTSVTLNVVETSLASGSTDKLFTDDWYQARQDSHLLFVLIMNS